MDKSDLRTLWEYALLIAPAPIGALIGMGYAKEQSPRARTVSWLCSLVVGAVGGPFAGEYVTLSPYGVAIATIVAAAVGLEIIAGVHFVARSFASDPFGVVGKLLDVVARIFRRGQP